MEEPFQIRTSFQFHLGFSLLDLCKEASMRGVESLVGESTVEFSDVKSLAKEVTAPLILSPEPYT